MTACLGELDMGFERMRFFWLSSAAMSLGLVAGSVWAQAPGVAEDASVAAERPGFFHRFLHHASYQLHDKFIGRPETFIEPPLGFYVKEQMTMQVAKADAHRFMLYRSDFLPGTDRFSPTGAARFNLMYSRLQGWLGPVTIEWTPDEPGLAAARRQTVLATLQRAGRPLIAERVLIGPSPSPGATLSGLAGTESANNLNNLIVRSSQAALAYPPTPQSGAYAYSTGGTTQ
jgi:hypothetical protein